MNKNTQSAFQFRLPGHPDPPGKDFSTPVMINELNVQLRRIATQLNSCSSEQLNSAVLQNGDSPAVFLEELLLLLGGIANLLQTQGVGCARVAGYWCARIWSDFYNAQSIRQQFGFLQAEHCVYELVPMRAAFANRCARLFSVIAEKDLHRIYPAYKFQQYGVLTGQELVCLCLGAVALVNRKVRRFSGS